MARCTVCGCDGGTAKDLRSVPQIRRYFSVIRNTFANWPESHDEQFSSSEECRKWLQMKAGYREIALEMPIMGVRPDVLIIVLRAALQAAGSFARPVEHKGKLIVWKPRSIAFDKMPHAEFCKLVEDVEQVIVAETGMPVQELAKESA